MAVTITVLNFSTLKESKNRKPNKGEKPNKRQKTAHVVSTCTFTGCASTITVYSSGGGISADVPDTIVIVDDDNANSTNPKDNLKTASNKNKSKPLIAAAHSM